MRSKILTAVFVLATLGVGSAVAADLPPSKQTKLGLYLSAEEAARFLETTPQAVMVDVRTPEEIDETGMADGVDALIPLAIADPKRGAVFNPDFFRGFAQLAADKGLGPDHPMVIICRSGNRSAQAANALTQMGFTQVYTVTDGYLGDRSAGGQRDVNGWRNAGLPWHPRKSASCAPSDAGGAC